MAPSDNDSVSKNTVSSLKAAPWLRDRPLYLLIFSGAIFHAHWSFYLPRLEDSSLKLGKQVQVAGNPYSGFWLEIIRGCNLEVDFPRPIHIIEIGRLRMEYVNDGPEITKWTVDLHTIDEFEELCRAVPPPTPSLKGNAASMDSRVCSVDAIKRPIWLITTAQQAQKPRRTEIRDCQWWVARVVQKLVEGSKLVPPTSGDYMGWQPMDIIEQVPKHA